MKNKSFIYGLLLALVLFLPNTSNAWSYSGLLKDARNNAITTYAGTGAYLDFYNGTQPTTCGAATTSLLTYTWGSGNSIANTSSGGVMSIITTALSSVVTGAGGVATWARITKSDHTTCVLDFSLGIAGSGADVILGTTTLSTGLTVTISTLTVTSGS